MVLDLLRHGYRVRGLARRPSPSTRAMPRVAWYHSDLAKLRHAIDWMPLVHGCQFIVNCAGVLQDSGRDRLEDVHVAAIAALTEAMPEASLLVQISAPGVSLDSSTEFYRSKARGDAAIRASGKRHVILRPAVVVSAEAYGGTALLRALAAWPGFIPVVNPDSPIKTVALDDVLAAIRQSITGGIAPGSDMVLAEATPHRLADVLLAFRQWLGFRPAPIVAVPQWLAAVVACGADVAGHLGWRSPLRSTALRISAEGVAGESGIACKSLSETLAAMPSTVQERWFARLYLLKPLGILTLSVFWLLSGLIGLFRADAAAGLLTTAGFAPTVARAVVLAGSAMDILLGLLVLHRRTMAVALPGMVVLTLAYLASASVFISALWLDPLGPLVKTIPAAVLALFLMAVAAER